jgi:hypothetical protein
VSIPAVTIDLSRKMQHLTSILERQSHRGNVGSGARLEVKAMENLSEQFRRLEAIARSASTFLFPSGDKYPGPIQPVGIIRQTK